MKRLGLFLCALLVGVALNGARASAHGWHHHHHGWHHCLHDGGLFCGWHHGFRIHSAGAPTRMGPHCWVSTDDRGFGYYKWCDDAKAWFRHHRHHRHHHHHMM